MAKILNFEKVLSKNELDKITEFAENELSAPVQLHDRRPKPEKLKPTVTLKPQPPKKAA